MQYNSEPKKLTYLVNVRFKAVGSAPTLRTQLYKISATQRFETVVKFLRTRLRVQDTDSVFLYVNSVFAPSLDEIVGNLYSVSLFMFFVFICVLGVFCECGGSKGRGGPNLHAEMALKKL